MLWFDPNHKFLIVIYYAQADHLLCTAQLLPCFMVFHRLFLQGSRLQISRINILAREGKKQRQNQEFREQTVFGGFAYFYTSEKHKDQSRQPTLTLTSSLWLIARAECSRALITEAYESENFVYFPTRAMEHCSNSLSDLRHKQLRTPYKEMCHEEYWKNPICKHQK